MRVIDSALEDVNMGLDKNSGFKIGKGKPGKLNLITDVPGVKVGHVTLRDGDVNTGVTAILPHEGNIFRDKVMAASMVINGFGKTMGLVQVDELGTIETPVIMTNTLSIGTAATALIKYMLSGNPDIGLETGSVNPIICECNDGALNDIRGLHVTEAHVFDAIANADVQFAEGAVGSGTGMTCFGMKGGIGSASRVVRLDTKDYTIGALVMSNFGELGNLRIDGEPVGRRMKDAHNTCKKDKGSIIMLLATDIPLSERQLKRICRRAGVGLARTGSFYGNGSGDIAIAFTTANRVSHYNDRSFVPMTMMDDEHIDPVLEMSAEVVEEAIISSLWHAETITGRSGKMRRCIRDYLSMPE